MAHFERRRGKGAAMRISGTRCEALQTVSTGSPGSDLPQGGIVKGFGPESSDKTTLRLQIIVEALKGGMFIDAEYAIGPLYEQSLGVKVDNRLVSQLFTRRNTRSN